MNASPKSTEVPPERPGAAKPETGEIPPAIAFGSLFHKGMVRFAEVEKNALDHIVHHNAEFQNTWTQVYKAPSAPAMVLLDMAVQGFEKFAEAQKELMDLAVEQSALALDIAKEGAGGAANRGKNVFDIIYQSTNKFIAAEKKVLDLAVEQNAQITERFKRQFGLADSSPAVVAAESMRKTVDAVIEAQKQMVDLAAKPLKAAAAAAAPKAASA